MRTNRRTWSKEEKVLADGLLPLLLVDRVTDHARDETGYDQNALRIIANFAISSGEADVVEVHNESETGADVLRFVVRSDLMFDTPNVFVVAQNCLVTAWWNDEEDQHRTLCFGRLSHFSLREGLESIGVDYANIDVGAGRRLVW